MSAATTAPETDPLTCGRDRIYPKRSSGFPMTVTDETYLCVVDLGIHSRPIADAMPSISIWVGWFNNNVLRPTFVCEDERQSSDHSPPVEAMGPRNMSFMVLG
mmetsp:Transcript_3145/g.4787  ORF Transcript_3145/g.4787 Transcript_3145/m.4787 type:complete len:103 (+) Transcript_3145:413-721(+)|eukprot:CAMPEP_0170069830 /NCGR_PEP_ID=MMETSP0019_2-20121128/8354_1 /TAXON_ID=98059 /ORGANISM="Dinobryon sp., Strain UTEXLB2267" /LENGTH=102 /DNA_ID=CAMNT_0010277965 /DNA_START=377 /DNA_END=685 /DNA_ORIENTATION=+